MSKNEILEALKKNEGYMVFILTESDESEIFWNDEDKRWKVRSFMGYLLYTSEELAEEMAEWTDKVLDIH